jgi:hypothetical protein
MMAHMVIRGSISKGGFASTNANSKPKWKYLLPYATKAISPKQV